MQTYKLRLKNQVAGFDVVKKDSEGTTTPWTPEVEAKLGEYFELTRQPQFVGSAEILYETEGKALPPEETGAATIRRDRLMLTRDPKNPYFLQTDCECR